MKVKIATHDSATGERGKGFLSFLVSPFARTQSKTILEQYEAGCRSFDIRVRLIKGRYYCAHGLWVSRRYASEILCQINAFPETCQVCVTYEGVCKDKEEFLLFSRWCRRNLNNIIFGKFCLKYDKKATVHVSYGVVSYGDYRYSGGVQGFLPLDGRSWHTYLPIPWLWDRLYKRPHKFNDTKFTFVDFL